MTENDTAHSGGPSGERNQIIGTSQTKRRRILVADDDSAIRQLSTEVLIRSGYGVDVAADGADAWEALVAETYDLLITDYNMPKVSGVELLKKVRAARMNLPVILVSGFLPAEELSRNSGFFIQAMLTKPFTVTQLLGAVNEVLHARPPTPQPETSPLDRGSPTSEEDWRL